MFVIYILYNLENTSEWLRSEQQTYANFNVIVSCYANHYDGKIAHDTKCTSIQFQVRHLNGEQQTKGRFTHSMPCPCRAHAFPLPYRAAKGLEWLSHLIYTVRPCLIHTCHAMLRPCRSSQSRSTARPSLDGCAVLWSWEERHGRSMTWQVWIRHGRTL